MAIESWIDKVAAAFGTISVGGGRETLTSYRVFTRAETPSKLTKFPCAVTYVTGLRPIFSAGAISGGIWSGVTEVHITSSLDNALLPDVQRYFDKVVAMMAVNQTLTGAVQYFLLPEMEDAISMDVVEYGQDGAPHFALIVNWRVRETFNKAISG